MAKIKSIDAIKSALREGNSLVQECERLLGRGRQANLLYRRARRFLERVPSGNEVFHFFLSSSSAYESYGSSRMVAPREEVMDLLFDSGIPILWLSEKCPEKRGAYTFWYNRLLRTNSDFKFRRRLSSPQKKDLSAPMVPQNYFEITTHELNI